MSNYHEQYCTNFISMLSELKNIADCYVERIEAAKQRIYHSSADA